MMTPDNHLIVLPLLAFYPLWRLHFQQSPQLFHIKQLVAGENLLPVYPADEGFDQLIIDDRFRSATT